jgi:hypothetical protein
MFTWPEVDLTDYERNFVRTYKTDKYPGVLKRIYQAQVYTAVNQEPLFTVARFSDQVQISRRSRIFGLTFVGDIDSWELEITNASGTLYTLHDNINNAPPVVSSMVPGTFYNRRANIGQVPAVNNTQIQMTSFPLLIEPNWVLLPNETLIFNAALTGAAAGEEDEAYFLGIGIHVWEFPKMGTSDAGVREVL